MRRIALIAALLAGAASAFAATAAGDDSHTYFIELDNAFGLVNGSEVKVAGVAQGTIEDLQINADKRAVAKVKLSGPLSALGEDTICSSEPQSLIAEYFIDCVPKGPPLTEGEGSDSERVENPDIPVEQTRQTVQNDLVQSALRMPFRDRLRIIINEFGTALAGNPDNLNDAIRRGAPALESARKVTKVLASQNKIIRDLNANSDQIVAKLNARSADVVKFIKNARATADTSASVRDDLSQNFADLDDFLAELGPTMTQLNDLAVTQTPLLRDLRASGPGLNTLSRNLPDFNSAGTTSLKTLGKAAVVGKRALTKGQDEISQLAKSSKKAFSVADSLAKFLSDIDDPRRAIEIDERVSDVTSRTSSKPGTKNTMGYTGLEGLLNYIYYQAGAVSQYDQISHLLHFSIFEVGTGPCANYNAGSTVPAAGGGETTSAKKADRCVAWLGKNQPGINEDVPLPPYDGSVCPDGSTDLSICDPSNTSSRQRTSLADTVAKAEKARGSSGSGGAGGSGEPADGSSGSAPDTGVPGSDGSGSGGGTADGAGDGLPGALDGILGLGKQGKKGKGKAKGNGGNGLGDLGSALGLRQGGQGVNPADASGDLLGYLFGN